MWVQLDNLFSTNHLYSRNRRSSLLPEQKMPGLLLQVFYTVRSERLLMEELAYKLLLP